MSGSLVDTLTGLISPQVADSAASRLGETEGATQKGLLGGAAAILNGISSRSGDSGFMERIYGLVTHSANDMSLPSVVSSLTGGAQKPGIGDLGTRLLSEVFGSQQSSVTETISRTSGLKQSSASGILGMAAPLVLGLLGQRVRDQNLTPASFGNMISAEAPGFQKYLPAGLGSLISGAGSLAGGAHRMAASAASTEVASASSARRWILPVLGVLALGSLLWYFAKGRNPEVSVRDTADRTAQVATGSVNALGEFVKQRLPNGTELNVPRFGIENKLVAFIEDSSRPADDTTWFNFDRLQFDSGKATLQPSSQEQVDNIANILKAHPTTKVKIGGYTDNIGDDAMNQKLSADRANTVMSALVQAGVAPDRLSAEGYGAQNPVADNATEEGRAKNRRIALQVVDK